MATGEFIHITDDVKKWAGCQSCISNEVNLHGMAFAIFSAMSIFMNLCNEVNLHGMAFARPSEETNKKMQ